MLILFFSNRSEKMTSMFFSNDFSVDYKSKILSVFNTEQKLYKHVPFDKCSVNRLGNLEVYGDFI